MGVKVELPWCIEGCFRLGVMYCDGLGVEQDYAKAEELFIKAFKWCFKPDIMYYDGLLGFNQDYTKVKELFIKACESGDTSGYYALGVMYSLGIGVEQDCTKAEEFFDKGPKYF